MPCLHWLLSPCSSQSSYNTVHFQDRRLQWKFPRVKVRQTDLWPQPGLGTATNHSLVRYAPLPAALRGTLLVSAVTSEATHGVRDKVLASHRTGTNSGFALSLKGLDWAKQAKASWFLLMAADYGHDSKGPVLGSDLHVWAKPRSALSKRDAFIPPIILSKQERYLRAHDFCLGTSQRSALSSFNASNGL